MRVGLHESPDRSQLSEHQLERHLAGQFSDRLQPKLASDRNPDESEQ
jgi:hypothetical protein